MWKKEFREWSGIPEIWDRGYRPGADLRLGRKLLKKDFHVFVAMGCGEQQKGQITEARRFAIKYGLDNLTVIIDYNVRQISGSYLGDHASEYC